MADVQLSELKTTDPRLTQDASGVFQLTTSVPNSRATHRTHFELQRDTTGALRLTSIVETITQGKRSATQAVMLSGGNDPEHGWVKVPMAVKDTPVEATISHVGKGYDYKIANADEVFDLKLETWEKELVTTIIAQRIVLEEFCDKHPEFRNIINTNGVTLPATLSVAFPNIADLSDLPAEASRPANASIKPLPLVFPR